MNTQNRRIVAIGLLALSFSLASQAAKNEIAVTGIENAKIVVKSSGGLAAVQPTAVLKFDFASCKNQNFSVKISKPKTGPTKLTVVSVDGMFDCFGPAVRRSYALQISSDAKLGTSYVLTNSLPVEYTGAITIPSEPIAPPPVTTLPIPENEDSCLKELETEIKRIEGTDGFENLAALSKKDAVQMLNQASWDDVTEIELANAKALVSNNSSLTFQLNWTAPSNSGSSVVVVPNKDNCKKYLSIVTWSEE